MRTLRSSLRRLFPIKRMLRACATITSCPNSLNHRLTHGECIPVSSAIRLCGILPNSSRMAFGVVLTFGSTPTSPVASRTQYQLDRSPRSSVVGLQSFHLPCCCSADLLHCRSPLSLAPSSAITWEPTASRRSPASSSHLFATVISNNSESCRGGVECWSLLPYLRPSDRGQTCAISFAFLAAFSLSVSTIHVQNLSELSPEQQEVFNVSKSLGEAAN